MCGFNAAHSRVVSKELDIFYSYAGRAFLTARKSPRYALVPIAAVALMLAACGSDGSESKPTGTPTPDVPIGTTNTPGPAPTQDSPEGILNTANWEIGILSWDEEPSNLEEGTNAVTLSGLVRNSTGGLQPYPVDIPFEITAEGFTFPMSSYPIFTDDYVSRSSDPQGRNSACEIPPGYSFPIELTANIPQIYSDYSIGIRQSSKEVSKDTVAANFPRIEPNDHAELRDVSEIWEVEGASISFNEILTEQFTRRNSETEDTRQVISIDIQNNLGDRAYPFPSFFGPNACVVLRDGSAIIFGANRITDSDSDEGIRVPVGFTEAAYIEIGGWAYDGEIFDTQGATVLLSLGNGENIEWKLP